MYSRHVFAYGVKICFRAWGSLEANLITQGPTLNWMAGSRGAQQGASAPSRAAMCRVKGRCDLLAPGANSHLPDLLKWLLSSQHLGVKTFGRGQLGFSGWGAAHLRAERLWRPWWRNAKPRQLLETPVTSSLCTVFVPKPCFHRCCLVGPSETRQPCCWGWGPFPTARHCASPLPRPLVLPHTRGLRPSLSLCQKLLSSPQSCHRVSPQRGRWQWGAASGAFPPWPLQACPARVQSVILVWLCTELVLFFKNKL